MVGIIIDVLVIAVFIISFISMSKKGIVELLFSLCGHVVTFVLVAVLLNPVTEYIEKTPVGEFIFKNVNSIVLNDTSGELPSEILSSEPSIIEKILISEGIQSIKEASLDIIVNLVIKIIVAIILFILLRIIIALLSGLLESVFNLPLLYGVNKIAGGIVGIVNALLILYIVCAVLSLNFEWANSLRGFVDQTKVLKYFYINNLLINAFIH